MEQATLNENAERRRKYYILSVIITVIVIYAAVPTYGIVRDISKGQLVFVLNSELPGAQMKRPVLGFFNRFYGLLSSQQKVSVPAERRIDLAGRVVYTDYSPCQGGVVELRYGPRQTRTDNEGYFLFTEIKGGDHTLSVLDGAGKTLAECKMTVKWMPGNEGLALTRLPDGTCVFQVPVQVKVLEITIFLRRGADGKVTSIESIMLGFVPEDAGRPEDPTSPLHPGGPGKPAKPGGPTVRPGNPAVPPEQGGGSSAGGGSGSGGGGSGNGGSVPPSYGFNVLDTATCASYGTSGAIGVDIFGSHKRLAPGMNGRYLFTVDNTGNRYPSLYDVEFEVKDTLPGSLKIPLLYRLKADGVYVAGNESTWCTAPELYQKSVVAGGGGVEYTLDWHWPEGANDNEFSAYAGDPAYSYSLTVKVRAQAQ